MSLLIPIIGSISGSSVHAVTIALLLALITLAPADQAFVPAFRESNPHLKEYTTLSRVPAGDTLDLVVVYASPDEPFFMPVIDRRLAWHAEHRIGIFLQTRSAPGLYTTLAIDPGPHEDCMARVERATSSEVVISCIGEKSDTHDTIKYLYDVRSRRLVKKLTYAPFEAYEIRKVRDDPFIVACDEHSLLLLKAELNPGDWEIVPEAAAEFVLSLVKVRRWTVPGAPPFVEVQPPDLPIGKRLGPDKRFTLAHGDFEDRDGAASIQEIFDAKAPNTYPLPETRARDLITARKSYADAGDDVELVTIDEKIGPFQIEDNRLWFGKTFYDSEGYAGIGGFGYFDFDARKYTLYSLPELAEWSVSAILVEPRTVWLTLMRRGEWGNTTGGLVRWSRDTRSVRTMWLPGVARQIARHGDSILVATRNGVTVITGDTATHYIVDQLADGRLRVVPRQGARP